MNEDLNLRLALLIAQLEQSTEDIISLKETFPFEKIEETCDYTDKGTAELIDRFYQVRLTLFDHLFS